MRVGFGKWFNTVAKETIKLSIISKELTWWGISHDIPEKCSISKSSTPPRCCCIFSESFMRSWLKQLSFDIIVSSSFTFEGHSSCRCWIVSSIFLTWASRDLMQFSKSFLSVDKGSWNLYISFRVLKSSYNNKIIQIKFQKISSVHCDLSNSRRSENQIIMPW